MAKYLPYQSHLGHVYRLDRLIFACVVCFLLHTVLILYSYLSMHMQWRTLRGLHHFGLYPNFYHKIKQRCTAPVHSYYRVDGNIISLSKSLICKDYNTKLHLFRSIYGSAVINCFVRLFQQTAINLEATDSGVAMILQSWLISFAIIV